eukprot:gene14280-10879_t
MDATLGAVDRLVALPDEDDSERLRKRYMTVYFGFTA